MPATSISDSTGRTAPDDSPVGSTASKRPILLTLVGDLCDFWFASRQQRAPAATCEGLKALLDFQGRGGSVIVMGGNHDGWLGDYYRRSLGLPWAADSLDQVVCGLRIHAVHGHRLGARSAWKGVMESRAFLRTFGAIPQPLAAGLEHLLERKNQRGRAASDRRHLIAFRRYADQIADRTDLVVFGHIHRTIDDRRASSPRGGAGRLAGH